MECLLHIIFGHALLSRHGGVRKRAEETGSGQPELHTGEVKADTNCEVPNISN